MTTIAWDGKTLAADSLRTNEGVVTSRSHRKILSADRSWFGFSGTATHEEIVRQWIAAGCKFPAPTFDGVAIVVPPRGTHPFVLESEAAKGLRIDGGFAVGSGRDFALGALEVGADAREAVRAAIRHDIYSGGVVRTVTLR